MFALQPNPVDGDLALFMEAFRCESEEEICSIAARSERTVWHLLNRAKDTFFRGNYRSAKTQFQSIRKISKRFPNLDLSASYYLALSLEQSNDVTGAMTLFESILAIEPKHEKAREGIARIRNGKNITADQLACSSRGN
jgi:hypothetical protein